MSRFGVSAEFVRPGLVGGIEQALHYYVDGLVSTLDGDDVVAVIGTDTPFVEGPHLQVLAPPQTARVRFVQETMTYRALGDTFDVYYFPNYFTPPGSHRSRTVTTIPDLQYRHLPGNFSRKKRAWLRAAHWHTLKRADVVTTFSSFVRDDIADRYGSKSAERTVVLPIPVSWARFDSHAPVAQQSDRRYILGVSSHYKHKNLATLIRAFKRVHERNSEVDLVLVGQFSRNLIGVSQAEDVPRLIQELELGHVVRATGFVTTSELGNWYRQAQLFVFPSVFEGFGLPPVEAIGFGLPVITTKCASLPEVTRGLADLVSDPFDEEELAQLMLQRLADGRRPSDKAVEEFRAFYAPERIGGELYRVLTG
jgi:glycosyltransferase involved in cell wall biosynthesis